MLDDLKMIHDRDAQDALGVAEKQWQQLSHVFELGDWRPSKKVSNVIYAGMGGSSLAALLATTWPQVSVPFEICRQYDIPAYVDENTLFIAASYSGNTEETIAALQAAEAKGAQIVVIAGGGKLQEIADTNNHLFIPLPKAEQPRFAVLYNLKALVQILEQAQVAAVPDSVSTLEKAGEFLKHSTVNWTPTVPTAKNPAKQLAQELMGKSVVVYAGPRMSPAAYKWKISVNENAKNVAWWGTLPEFNHNEFIGWSSHPMQKPYAVVDLRSTQEHERVQKRFEVSDRLLSGQRPAALVVDAQGTSILEQLLWTVAYGDFVTLYLAMLNGVNPTPVVLVEKFKKELV